MDDAPDRLVEARDEQFDALGGGSRTASLTDKEIDHLEALGDV
ncbi:hypothetical protein [Candidatus Halobonum tyrrellensis]|nr:hypothetical protein [Candidatus Halobonum tyrrellensis]